MRRKQVWRNPFAPPFRGELVIGNFENQKGVKLSEVPKMIKAAEEAYWKALREGRSEVKVKLETGNGGEFRTYGVEGQIELHPIQSYLGPAVEGRFSGHVMIWNPETKSLEKTGERIELKLNSSGGRFGLGPKIYADEERELGIDVVESESGQLKRVGELTGTIPRPVLDRLAVPLETERLDRLHSQYGKTYDLALVYTWIASLLNVLVIWDAFEGPAYGYGDEPPEGEAEASKSGKQETEGDGPPKAKSEKHTHSAG